MIKCIHSNCECVNCNLCIPAKDREFRIQYGKSKLDAFIFRPAAIKYLPKKITLWVELKYLEWKRDEIIRRAAKMFNGKLIKDENDLYQY